jgi:DNA repair exonuclease SbcCD nuclease subunit
MIVAHLSDLHLGHRSFDRAERGQNLRERDLSVAFQRAIALIIRESPDLVVVAGDVFDRPNPPPGALVALTRGLDEVRTALPDTRVLMVAGARDTPRRTEDAGALAALDTFPNVEAAAGRARAVDLAHLSVHAILLPYRSAKTRPLPAPEPDVRQRWNLVVAHGRIATGPGEGIPLEERRWDYVALGGQHTFRRVSDRVVYSGALERVGASPWDEAAEEKGFVIANLESGEVRFVPVPGRPVVALAPTHVPVGDPARLQARLEEVVREVPGGIEGKIVRIRLRGTRPADLSGLDTAFLTRLVDEALHFSIELTGAPVPEMDRTPLIDRVTHHLDTPDDRTVGLLRRVLGSGAGGTS